MGRQLQRVHSGVQYEGYHPGCLWSILHILGFGSGEAQSSLDADNFLDATKNANPSSTISKVSSWKKRTGKLLNQKADLGDSVNVEDNLGEYQLSEMEEKVMANSKSQKMMDSKQLKEYVDVLEIFKVNKEQFLKIFKESDIGVSENSPGQQISNKKAKLTKSGSFPVADPSRLRNLRPSTIEHKQNETWTSPKEKLLVCSTKKGDDNGGSAVKQKANTNSQGSSQASSHQKWKKLLTGYFRGRKQRIKHAVKENKKENDYSKTEGQEMPRGLENISEVGCGAESSRFYQESNGSEPDLGKSRRQMRRTASLNESPERHAWLFESSCGREAKLPHSSSLKLRNEDKTASKEHIPKFFRSVSSLPDLESFSSLLNELAHGSEMPVSTEVACNTNSESDKHDETKSSSPPQAKDNLEPLIENREQGSDNNASMENSGPLILSRIGEKFLMSGQFGENIIDALKVASITPQDEVIVSSMDPTICLEQQSPDPIPENCFPGSELNLEQAQIDEADSSFNIQHESKADYLPDFCDTVITDKDNQLQHFELGENEPSFNYVGQVLMLSGFVENDCHGTWYSLDQPLNPSVYKELEEYLHHEPQYSPESIGENCEHQLLFDLTNEVLIELSERSLTYFPLALSFNRLISPMPKGKRVVNEVWSRICWYITFRTNLDQSLDGILAQDLTKGNGWLIHQFETECVALEVEDLICDELLDELMKELS
ncbi:protein TRM32 isoform X3 [Mangifera indica]|uniref:protein TRM32 isoform X3 n=1 Tax=Mangifera indica TaxID=29780 RepID=UPI001CF9816E|nr:protein TRM32 isoform X3 [Mangifera indica]